MDHSAAERALCMPFARLCSHASTAACHGTQGVSGARHRCAARGARPAVQPLPLAPGPSQIGANRAVEGEFGLDCGALTALDDQSVQRAAALLWAGKAAASAPLRPVHAPAPRTRGGASCGCAAAVTTRAARTLPFSPAAVASALSPKLMHRAAGLFSEEVGMLCDSQCTDRTVVSSPSCNSCEGSSGRDLAPSAGAVAGAVR